MHQRWETIRRSSASNYTPLPLTCSPFSRSSAAASIYCPLFWSCENNKKCHERSELALSLMMLLLRNEICRSFITLVLLLSSSSNQNLSEWHGQTSPTNVSAHPLPAHSSAYRSVWFVFAADCCCCCNCLWWLVAEHQSIRAHPPDQERVPVTFFSNAGKRRFVVFRLCWTGESVHISNLLLYYLYVVPLRYGSGLDWTRVVAMVCSLQKQY